MNDQPSVYDRELLLLGSKRNALLELWEVERYGKDSYGDADYVSIYGMRPADWYGNGARLLGRTAVECTRDELANGVARDIAVIVSECHETTATVVVDPFVGSANTLYWILRHIAGARGIGFESDSGVFNQTRQNIRALALAVAIENADYRSGLSRIRVAPDDLLVVFIAPPWGKALDRSSGLDLRRTSPPVPDIVDFLRDRFPENKLLCAIQVYEICLPASLVEVKARFDWSAERIYELNERGQNHGIVLATRGWIPHDVDRSDLRGER